MSGADDDELWQRLNSETGRITWGDLQRYYASGAVVAVSSGLDLVEVAAALARDDKVRFEQWLAAGEVAAPSDEQAQQWYQSERQLWAVVVAPWVLVQPAAQSNG